MQELGCFSLDDEPEPTLTDVTEFALPDLLSSDNSVLANALRRLLQTMEQPGDNYAAHGTTP